MYYRRKVLLALVEAFGGTLTKTDCQKLLLLLCHRTPQPPYDFFPHRYGGYSLVASHDQEWLSNQGLLCSHPAIIYQGTESFLNQLHRSDRQALESLVSEVGNLRGKALWHKAYIEYPQYVSRSTIAAKVLSPTEHAQVCQRWCQDRSPCLFTLGYEGLSIDRYLNILIDNNITLLVDVRNNPQSRKYGFSKVALSEALRRAGMRYMHIPELGIPSVHRRTLNSSESYSVLFDYYTDEILPAQGSPLEKLRMVLARTGRAVLTCFERDPYSCHRHKLTAYLEKDANFRVPIVHLQA
jgi:hypothetical protein